MFLNINLILFKYNFKKNCLVFPHFVSQIYVVTNTKTSYTLNE